VEIQDAPLMDTADPLGGYEGQVGTI